MVPARADSIYGNGESHEGARETVHLRIPKWRGHGVYEGTQTALLCVIFKISRTEVVSMQIYYHTAVSPLSRGLWCKEVLFFTVSLEKKIKAMLTIGFWYFIKSPIEINLHNLIMLSIWIQKETRDNKAFQSQDNLQKIFGINNQEIESPFIYFLQKIDKYCIIYFMPFLRD